MVKVVVVLLLKTSASRRHPTAIWARVRGRAGVAHGPNVFPFACSPDLWKVDGSGHRAHMFSFVNLGLFTPLRAARTSTRGLALGSCLHRALQKKLGWCLRKLAHVWAPTDVSQNKIHQKFSKKNSRGGSAGVAALTDESPSQALQIIPRDISTVPVTC